MSGRRTIPEYIPYSGPPGPKYIPFDGPSPSYYKDKSFQQMDEITNKLTKYFTLFTIVNVVIVLGIGYIVYREIKKKDEK